MSWRPSAFAAFPPTGRVWLVAFEVNHAMFPTSVSSFDPLGSPGIEWNAVVVPARYAYSHSASVGSRSPVAERKPWIVFHDTVSTGRFGTCAAGTSALADWKYDGFDPILAVHCACVTS
jgi:hypothetical protein